MREPAAERAQSHRAVPARRVFCDGGNAAATPVGGCHGLRTANADAGAGTVGAYHASTYPLQRRPRRALALTSPPTAGLSDEQRAYLVVALFLLVFLHHFGWRRPAMIKSRDARQADRKVKARRKAAAQQGTKKAR